LQPGRKPILCYVTNRRPLGGLPQLRESIHSAVGMGLDWIQIREKDLSTQELLELARFVVQETRDSKVRAFVNDRFDVALATGAAGVHLGESSIPVRNVACWRRAGGRSNLLIGASCHSPESAVNAERDGADYVFYGPVYATPSKEAFGPPQGIERLKKACEAVRIPVLAIGGITTANARSCIAAGAAGIAAIRMFQESPDFNDAVSQLQG
jgi:thiamine-phosphate pyrophosphorylase